MHSRETVTVHVEICRGLPIRAQPVWQAVVAVFLCAAPRHSMGGDEGEVVEAQVGTAGITRNQTSERVDSHQESNLA